MGEIITVLFLGAWMVTASMLSYRHLKGELSDFAEEKE